ncbi:MAG TPA: hypothetical protein DF383_00980 [Deltaproteobacteria bacterium]|nr:hypothetical protein [Deltaproteobacteria bacterium]
MKKSLFIIPLLFLFASSAWAGGRMSHQLKVAPPRPPEVNPHPPQSAEDQRRVDFAVAEIKAQYGPDVEIRHPHIIPWSYEKFLKNRGQPASPAKSQGKPIKADMDPPMQGPVLKPDEYMVHAYVNFPNDPRWHHMDVIMSEDSSGKLTRRGFYSFPMPSSPARLPPGAVC